MKMLNNRIMFFTVSITLDLVRGVQCFGYEVEKVPNNGV